MAGTMPTDVQFTRALEAGPVVAAASGV